MKRFAILIAGSSFVVGAHGKPSSSSTSRSWASPEEVRDASGFMVVATQRGSGLQPSLRGQRTEEGGAAPGRHVAEPFKAMSADSRSSSLQAAEGGAVRAVGAAALLGAAVVAAASLKPPEESVNQAVKALAAEEPVATSPLEPGSAAAASGTVAAAAPGTVAEAVPRRQSAATAGEEEEEEEALPPLWRSAASGVAALAAAAVGLAVASRLRRRSAPSTGKLSLDRGAQLRGGAVLLKSAAAHVQPMKTLPEVAERSTSESASDRGEEQSAFFSIPSNREKKELSKAAEAFSEKDHTTLRFIMHLDQRAMLELRTANGPKALCREIEQRLECDRADLCDRHEVAGGILVEIDAIGFLCESHAKQAESRILDGRMLDMTSWGKYKMVQNPRYTTRSHTGSPRLNSFVAFSKWKEERENHKRKPSPFAKKNSSGIIPNAPHAKR
eukprot:TRINITY_DN101093_c0_g1_i1.p1 TRINITY_DN101093_c0_g1~~TRINITY_DN101093_c0_g1_i1.p1  ORF type:complete len:468 (-),score=131.77 TRINITY_DN101093_c0_g1_i1:161-1489(-)